MTLLMGRRLFFVAVGLVASLTGCAETIARRVVRAPNAAWAERLPLQTTVPAYLGMSLAENVRVRRIPVASGAISLRAVIIEPSDAPWQRITIREDPLWMPAWPGGHALKPLATIVILHGHNGSSEWTSPHAACLANAGFRCVLIDLRGHGESTGNTVSFGKYEAADIHETLGRLHADGTLGGPFNGPVVLMGCSLGGSVALMTAAMTAARTSASDSYRLDSVIAVAPFAQLSDVAPHFASHFAGWLTWLVTDGLTRNTITAMGHLGDFDPQTDSPLAWAPRVHVPTLLIHGSDDDLVPPEQSARLAVALGGPVTRVLIPGQEHIATVLEPCFSLPTILRWLESIAPADSYRIVDGPLVGWRGDGTTTHHALSATWAYRPHPSDYRNTWPRPAGHRHIRTWAVIPPSWLGRDLTFDLGTIDGADETWCGPLRIGRQPAMSASLYNGFRRYQIPGWLVTPRLEFTIDLTTTKENAGISWATGGTAILRPTPLWPKTSP